MLVLDKSISHNLLKIQQQGKKSNPVFYPNLKVCFIFISCSMVKIAYHIISWIVFLFGRKMRKVLSYPPACFQTHFQKLFRSLQRKIISQFILFLSLKYSPFEEQHSDISLFVLFTQGRVHYLRFLHYTHPYYFKQILFY